MSEPVAPEPMVIETESNPEPVAQQNEGENAPQSVETKGTDDISVNADGSEASEALSTTPAPKKRGRPPLPPGEKKSDPKKRGPGRPPKTEGEEDDGEAPSSLGSVDVPMTSSAPTTSGSVGDTPPVKRGRGRPRKGEVVIKPDTNKTPKKRGRPPKSATSEEEAARKKAKLEDGKVKKKKEEEKKKKKLQKVKKNKKTEEDAQFPHKINISVGADQSTGPGFYSVTIIKSTINSDELQKAYKAGTAKVGFDFQKEICTTSQNCSLSAHHFKKLHSVGIPLMDEGAEQDDPDLDFELTLESYRDIWLHIARVGNPQLNWVVAEFDALPIGGNGLFQDLIEQREKGQDEEMAEETKAPVATETKSTENHQPF